MEKSKIYDGINGILAQYAFEFNTPDTRKEILDRINEHIINAGMFPKLIDRTTPEMADRGEIHHRVSFMGAEMSLDEYLNTIL